jgi:Zn-dependent metalloprotease
MDRMTAARRLLLAATAISAVSLIGAASGCTSAGKERAPGANPGESASSPVAEFTDEPPAGGATASPAPLPRALTEHLTDVNASPADTFTVFRTRVDDGGGTHVRLTRTYQGLRVYGGDVVVHTDPAGGYRGMSNGLTEPLRLSTSPSVTPAAATAAARGRFAGTVSGVSAPRLFVDASSGVGRLAWESLVVGVAPDGQTPSRLHVVTDARSGAVLGSWDEIETIAGTGKSLYRGTVSVDTARGAGGYRMSDPSHGGNTVCDMKRRTSGVCTPLTDEDNAWGDGTNANPQSAAVDAYYGAALTYDYFSKVHGRKGVFDNGRGVPSRVHYGDNYANAFWDGRQMTYGDGEGNAWPLVALDIAGHEMSHGVTEHSVSGGLTYAAESGGLNEATSDIFGTMVEFYGENAENPANYLIGEDININGNGTPLRYMFDPAKDGHSHGCWSATTKDVDVHLSSGVGNHFFFNLAEGTGSTKYGTSPSCGNAPAVAGIGRDKAAKIWYRALDVYFTSSTSYVNAAKPDNTARAYTLQAAADLYGKCGAEYRAVRAAWTAVNVAGPDPAC